MKKKLISTTTIHLFTASISDFRNLLTNPQTKALFTDPVIIIEAGSKGPLGTVVDRSMIPSLKDPKIEYRRDLFTKNIVDILTECESAPQHLTILKLFNGFQCPITHSFIQKPYVDVPDSGECVHTYQVTSLQESLKSYTKDPLGMGSFSKNKTTLIPNQLAYKLITVLEKLVWHVKKHPTPNVLNLTEEEFKVIDEMRGEMDYLFESK